MSTKIVNAKEVHKRGKTLKVEQIGTLTYLVESGSKEGVKHTVRLGKVYKDGAVTYDGASCSCDWGKYRKRVNGFRSACSHAQAVFDHIANVDELRTTSAWDSQENARRQHRPIVDIGDGVVLTTRKSAERERTEMAKVLYGSDEDLI